MKADDDVVGFATGQIYLYKKLSKLSWVLVWVMLQPMEFLKIESQNVLIYLLSVIKNEQLDLATKQLTYDLIHDYIIILI